MKTLGLAILKHIESATENFLYADSLKSLLPYELLNGYIYRCTLVHLAIETYKSERVKPYEDLHDMLGFNVLDFLLPNEFTQRAVGAIVRNAFLSRIVYRSLKFSTMTLITCNTYKEEELRYIRAFGLKRTFSSKYLSDSCGNTDLYVNHNISIIL